MTTALQAIGSSLLKLTAQGAVLLKNQPLTLATCTLGVRMGVPLVFGKMLFPLLLFTYRANVCSHAFVTWEHW